jgi:hypothetical protein
MKHVFLAALLSIAANAAAGGFSDLALDAGQAESLRLIRVQLAQRPVAAPKPSMYAEERVCVATLRMKKSEWSLDPMDHLKNWAAAQDRDVIASESQCANWRLGEVISRSWDGVGFLFKGDVASYIVKVQAKRIEARWFEALSDGSQRELTHAQYDAALAALKAAGRDTVSMPAVGLTRTYVLDKPLDQYTVDSAAPLQRYFVNVHVQNSTLSLSVTKFLRNAFNTHEITLEVPKAVYDQTRDAWDAHLSGMAFFVKGNLSTLRGKVTKKWTRADPKYVVVTLDDGREIIMPKDFN